MNSKTKRATALVFVLVALGMGWVVAQRISTKSAATIARTATTAPPVFELTAIDVERVLSIRVDQNIAISGTLKARDSALVKARVTGQLQGFSLREGDAVKAGQVIARIDAEEYTARVQQVQQQADAAKAQVAIAQRQYDNNQSLVSQGFISQTALATASATLQAAQANYEAALSAVKISQKALTDTVLTAPINGTISQRFAQPGEQVGMDARVVEIVDLSRMELEAALSAADSLWVQMGQHALLQIETSPYPVSATVTRINPSAQAGSRNVLVYLQIDMADTATAPKPPSAQTAPQLSNAKAQQLALRQGLFAEGQLSRGFIQALTVKLDAVRTDKPEPYVQLIENDRVVHRNVETGLRSKIEGETRVVVQGIAENSAILSGRVGLMQPGSLVKLAPQMSATAP